MTDDELAVVREDMRELAEVMCSPPDKAIFSPEAYKRICTALGTTPLEFPDGTELLCWDYRTNTLEPFVVTDDDDS